MTAPPAIHYFGDYVLIHEIARGGMGVVYKARQVSLNRTVAVKVLLFGRLAGADFVKRFRAEAEAAASLQHANIVAIHEVGEHEGQQYFSMDYIEGTDLAELVREKPLPPKRAATYLKTIAEGIHYAHQRGILHRDLKPSNILIDTNDRPRITDFGLAKRLSANGDVENAQPEVNLTITGQILGTPAFMPPEQAGGKRDSLSPASDVYSLGALLYFLMTGRPPFIGDSLEEILRQVHENEPRSARELNASVPRDLEIICLKCLSKEPHRRYVTSQALAEDLGRFLRDEPICARPVGAAERLAQWCRRKPALVMLMLALLLVATAGSAGIVWQWRRAETIRLASLTPSVRVKPTVPHLVDLLPFYNGGKDEEFVGGLRRLAGTDFDARGWLQLDVSRPEPWNTSLPKRVNGIVIGQRCQRLHFLHTAVWMGGITAENQGEAGEIFEVPMGVAVGYYVVHYEDGQRADIPIIHGRDVRDYTYLPESPPDNPALVVAWTGSSANSRRYGGTARLYKSTWENHHPGLIVRSLDFVHGETHASPILVAITAE
jgi:predicted Ser/Thr protein kinase